MMTEETTYRYFKRDISWLSFNFRVLMEAADKSLPVSERINFIAIYTSNLEEFYRIRVAEHKAASASRRQIDESVEEANSLIDDITREVDRQLEFRVKVFEHEILPALEAEKVVFCQDSEVRDCHRKFVNSCFNDEIFPYLQPVPLDKGNINVFLRGNRLYMALRMHKRLADGGVDPRPVYYMMKMPYTHVPRFIELPPSNGMRFVMFMEDIIKACVGKMFPGYIVECGYCFKISRDADLLVDESVAGSEMVNELRSQLKKRKMGAVCRFVYDRHMPHSMLEHLVAMFGIKPDELVQGDKHLNLEDLSRFPRQGLQSVEATRPKPFHLRRMVVCHSVLDCIRQGDVMLHYPYHSFEHFLDFLAEASTDPMVSDIMVTQYRVAEDSAVISALQAAARNGKNVTVFVELKARFDEENNITSSEMLRQAGVDIIPCIPGLKVHAKVALVLRRAACGAGGDGYAYIGTGNFNEKTAKQYADCGLFTADPAIVGDLRKLFALLKGEVSDPVFDKLLVTRFNLLPTLKAMIEHEKDLVRSGRRGRIVLKMNAIQDEAMIDELYRASEAGVEIDLIVRGICCLVPGQPYSRNIRVTRIVDTFLEHARVWYFGNDGQPRMFIGSPDWMKRNLYKRIEAVVPVEDEAVKDELATMLSIQLADNVKGCFVDEHLDNVRKPQDGGRRVRAQYAFYDYLKSRNG